MSVLNFIFQEIETQIWWKQDNENKNVLFYNLLLKLNLISSNQVIQKVDYFGPLRSVYAHYCIW